MKVYTRRGDAGQTDLFGGQRVDKDDARVEAYGAVDELNASLGMALAVSEDDEVRGLGRRIQGELFELGAYLATPDEHHQEKASVPRVGDEDVEHLEKRIDLFEEELSPLKRFILPGGTPAAAAFHVARTVCRRAERRAVQLDRAASLQPAALRYLNRLSDLLFVLARLENARARISDVEWERRR